MTSPLDQLKDIHPGVAISIWPPALGWWLLLVILVIGVTATVMVWRRYKKQIAPRQSALKALKALETDANDLPQQIFTLLKQAALQSSRRENIAQLHGKQWLQFLDSCSPKSRFMERFSVHIETWLYSPQSLQDEERQALLEEATHWVQSALPLKTRERHNV